MTQVALTTVEKANKFILPAINDEGISALLPQHITPEFFARTAAVAIVSNPQLQQAEPRSIVLSLMKAAKDGLLCDNKEAALVVYNKNAGTKQNPNYIKEAVYMPMIDGVLKRARQSGALEIITAKEIYEHDEFDYWIDENGEHLKHKPKMNGRGKFIGTYAFAKFKDGGIALEVLDLDDIERSRNASQQANNEYGPWKKYYSRMGVKSAAHRLARRLPNSSEMLQMLEQGTFMEWQKEPNNGVEKDITPKTEAIENKKKAGLKSIMTGKKEAPIQLEHDPDVLKELQEDINNIQTVAQYKAVAPKVTSAVKNKLITVDQNDHFCKQLETIAGTFKQ